MPVDEDVHKILRSMTDSFLMYNQEIAKLQASVYVLRKAIASSQPKPRAYEKRLRRQEAKVQAAVLSSQGFPQLTALLALAKAGKSLDKPDS